MLNGIWSGSILILVSVFWRHKETGCMYEHGFQAVGVPLGTNHVILLFLNVILLKLNLHKMCIRKEKLTFHAIN